MIEVGGAGTLERSLATVRTGGRIAYIGVLTGLGAQANPVALIPKRQWRDATYEALASKSRPAVRISGRADRVPRSVGSDLG